MSQPQQPQGPAYAHHPQQGVGAPVPPPAAPKKKRNWLKIVGGVVLLLILAGCIKAVAGGGSTAAKSEAPAAPAGQTTSTAPKKEEPKKDAPAALNTPVKSGDMEFTVTGFACDVTVESFTTVTPQGHFCKLTLSAKNVGTKQVTLFDGQLVVKDAKGAEYKASSETFAVKDVILAKQINPGNTLTGAVYYDVPVDVVPNLAELKGDLFVAKPAKITLQ